MSPVLMEGDIVAWTPTRIEDIKTGDIIVFKSYVSWPDEKIVVHRVSDIKTSSKGEILLETKGDKNKWVDQAGPHIPEPYIREDHLMGKTISVGQIPLKVPFIGIFGIWINNGIEQLSQPTVEKEPATFIGLFAPMTISLVILIILIFVLPEKAKTIKEKIRMNIFGRKPLNLKKTTIMFLIAYLVFFSMIHAFAYDSVSSAVGINSQTKDAEIKFGNIDPGGKSGERFLPVYNPGNMPLKGIIYGTGELNNFVTRKTFNLERGGNKWVELRAVASKTSTKGAYTGDIMVYSSPFWTMLPDDFITSILDFNAEISVFLLDLITALILTGITLFILISITFILEKTNSFLIDRSWKHPSKIIIKKEITDKIKTIGKNTKKRIIKGIGWILKIKYDNIENKKFFSKYIKSFMASFVIIPILFLLNDAIIAMFIAVLIGGILAYFVSCKTRKKIVLTVFFIMIMTTSHMLIQSNIIILEKQTNLLETITLSIGVICVYLLIFTLLLIPLSAFVWYITHIMRNVKEEKEPLLSLEGRCDL